MSNIIAFTNRKGGVGKTTLSANTAFHLSLTKATVLIDADPQGNSSSYLIKGQPKFELVDVLQGVCTVKEALVKVADNFYILPTFTNGDLKNYAETKLFQEPFIFDDLNEGLKKDGIDLIIYDLSPGMSQLEKIIISSVDEIVCPLTPEYFSLDGIDMIIDELKKINKNYRKNVKFTKIVCNGLNKSFSRHNLIYKKFEEMDFDLFTIPQDSKLPESQLVHEPIFIYSPESKSIPEIIRLSDSLGA